MLLNCMVTESKGKWEQIKGEVSMNIFKRKIAAKLTLQTCLLVLAMVISIGSLSYYQASKAIENEVQARITQQLEKLVNTLNNEMRSVSEKLDMVGELDIIKDYDTQPQRAAEIGSILASILNKNTTYIETLFIADKNGNIVIDGSNGASTNLNIKDRSYFQDALSGKTVWSEIVTSKSSNQPVRVYAYPVKNKSGNITGVIAAAVKIEPIAKNIIETKEGKLGYAYLLDAEGNIVVHPVAENVGKNIKDMGVPELVNALPDMAAGKSGKVVYKFKGVTKLNVYMPFDNFSICLNAASSEYLAPVKKLGFTILVYGVVFMLLGAGVSVLISIVLVKKIKKMQSVAKLASDGDLTARITGKNLTDGDELDQMSNSMNDMLDAFNEVITEILTASEIMSSTSQQMAASAAEGGKAAGEVSGAIQQITEGLSEQAEFVLRTDKIVEDMQARIKHTSEETELMTGYAKKVMDTAVDSQSHMKSTMKQMDEIQSSSETTFKVIQTLSNQSEKIGQISLAISSIADQTNLLALNAAIEAARAGEQGRGFAVVAEEIRKLASESMVSAENIGKLIDQIQGEIKRAEEAISSESISITKGVEVIGETEAAFIHIIEAINRTLENTKSLISSTEDTKNCTYEVAKSMRHISEVSQESSSSAEEVSASTEEQNAISEEIASASEHLSRLAISLLEKVSIFKVGK